MRTNFLSGNLKHPVWCLGCGWVNDVTMTVCMDWSRYSSIQQWTITTCNYESIHNLFTYFRLEKVVFRKTLVQQWNMTKCFNIHKVHSSGYYDRF